MHICAVFLRLRTLFSLKSYPQATTASTWTDLASSRSTKVSAVHSSAYAVLKQTSIQALLPAPFLSSHRRARAFTQLQPVAAPSPLTQILNPQLSTPSRTAHAQSFSFSPAYLNTPPPNPALMNKFRLRGTVTDPAHTRRRPAFGQVSIEMSPSSGTLIEMPCSLAHRALRHRRRR